MATSGVIHRDHRGAVLPKARPVAEGAGPKRKARRALPAAGLLGLQALRLRKQAAARAITSGL